MEVGRESGGSLSLVTPALCEEVSVAVCVDAGLVTSTGEHTVGTERLAGVCEGRRGWTVTDPNIFTAEEASTWWVSGTCASVLTTTTPVVRNGS